MRELAPVVALTLVAFALRVSQLHQSLVGDEVYTYQDILGRSFSAVLTTVHTGGENSPPLFFLLAWTAAHLGDASVWIRVPSVVLGSATVPVVYALGREVFSRVAGLIAAAVFVLAPFAVFYGIEARPYATMTFFVALSTLALLRAVETDSRWWWALYVLSAAAAAYSHYTAVFVLAAQAIWSLWVRRDRIRPAVVANALIAALYLPWLPHLRGKALAVIGTLRPLSLRNVVTDLVRPIPGHPSAPLRAIPTIAGLLVFGLIALAGIVAVVSRRRPAGGARTLPALESPRTLMAGLVLATPVGLLLYSVLVTDLWLPRGLSASMPAAALILGALVSALPRPLIVLASAAIAVTLVAGTLRSFGPDYNRGPYRAIAAYIDRVAGPRDPVSIGTYEGAGPLFAQLHRRHWILGKGSLWPYIGGRATGYLVLDRLLALTLKVNPAPPAGFALVVHLHYGGAVSTDVYGYRRAPRNG